ncbi:MAG: hypothetical protein HY682_11065 [Chloroflexi bacterium]|nr:hypothetical protein [Chloroflexota bacterium]
MVLLNSNIMVAAEIDAAKSIAGRVIATRVAEAANLEDLTLLSASIAACARRERARTLVKYGEKSPRLSFTDRKVELLAQQETVVIATAEKTAYGVLALLG